MTNVITPQNVIRYVNRTYIGQQRDMDAITGSYDPADFDTKTAINNNYEVFPNLFPKQTPLLKYFMMGIGGRRNTNSDTKTAPVPVSRANLGLYRPIPFRCVPIENDLTDQDRENYRLRYVFNASNGQRMVAYYAKLISGIDSKTIFISSSKDGDREVDYTPDYSKLTPTPPDIPINGVVEDNIGNEVTVAKKINVPISGKEVLESVSVLYNGDLLNATVSEIGLCTGEDQKVTVLDAAGNQFSMTEAIGVQLYLHTTWNGSSFTSYSSMFTETITINSDDFSKK